MATRQGRKNDKTRLAAQGDAVGFAQIRLWTCAIETAMLERYIGNAPTLKDLRAVVKATLRDIRRIKASSMSRCPGGMAHDPSCICYFPPAR